MGLQVPFRLDELGLDFPELQFLGHLQKLRRRQGPGMGGVAQFLLQVEELPLFRRHGDIGHQDPAARAADPDHFGEHRLGVEEMVKGIAGHHQGKGGVRKGQGQDVADLPGQVGEPFSR